MMKTKRAFALAAALGAALWIGGLLIAAHSVKPDPTAKTYEDWRDDPEIERKVDELLARMTLEEKVGQMMQITLDVLAKGKDVYSADEPLELDPEQVDRVVRQYMAGSILNTANNRARTREKWQEVVEGVQAAAMKTRLKIPVLYGIDAIHGASYTAEATLFPQQIGLAATFDTALARQMGRVSAYETAACSLPWTFSPVLDMGRDPRNPRIWETFGEDVLLVSAMGEAMIQGYEGPNNEPGDPYRVASCIKHYLGYQLSRSGKDRTPAYIPDEELYEIHLPPFKAGVDAGAHSLMVNSAIINGRPVHASKRLLTDLLKVKLGFRGIVLTDWADIDNLYQRDMVAANEREATKMAINAGIDMAMVPYKTSFADHLIDLVKSGEVSMGRIDDAVRRILRVKFSLGLFENPSVDQADYPDFGSEKHEKVAYESALQSITLLKNEDNTLPLDKAKKVLVCGPNANSMRTLNGGWSYSWQGEKVPEFAGDYNTILEAIRAKVGKANVKYAAGVEYDFRAEAKYYMEKEPKFDEAVALAKGVDAIVLCLGENTYTEKPGDLDDLSISANQIELAKRLAATGKPVVVVLNEGRPRLISAFESEVGAIVQTYLPGNFGGDALAELLYGDANFSGKLPYTYPAYPNSTLTYDHKPAEKPATQAGMYDYGGGSSIQFPFGHGLSYTTYEYKNLKLSKSAFGSREGTIKASVEVTNSGKMAGKETVMLFTRDLVATLTPDVRRLRAFKKIDLAPGETKTVEFTLSAREVAFVDDDLRWTVEPGEFEAYVGPLKAKFTASAEWKWDE